MRQRRSYQFHLALSEITLLPTREWAPTLPGWVFIHVTSGTAYWLNQGEARELATGAVLLISPEARGCIRASQLGDVTVRFFSVEPGSLIGLMNLGEQEFFQRAASTEELAVRILSPGDAVATRFLKLCGGEKEVSLGMRIALLQLFAEIFSQELRGLKSKPKIGADAKERLTDLLQQTPAADLLDLTFADLLEKARCTPRHLSRVFREALGMSFREKQAEMRLTRARDLLATTGYKVVDVALESGYQSLSLFNLMFKRRFGVSPGKWREQIKARRDCRRTFTLAPSVRLRATTS
jgi:AraC-like DNA-binding protein